MTEEKSGILRNETGKYNKREKQEKMDGKCVYMMMQMATNAIVAMIMNCGYHIRFSYVTHIGDFTSI